MNNVLKEVKIYLIKVINNKKMITVNTLLINKNKNIFQILLTIKTKSLRITILHLFYIKKVLIKIYLYNINKKNLNLYSQKYLNLE